MRKINYFNEKKNPEIIVPQADRISYIRSTIITDGKCNSVIGTTVASDDTHTAEFSSRTGKSKSGVLWHNEDTNK